jgi:hypothetical protein
MDFQRKHRALILVACALMTGLGACKDNSTGPSASTPPPAYRPTPATVSFAVDVQPIFSDPAFGCTGCHGGSGGLSLASRQSLLKGGSHGPAVVAGNSAASNIVLKMGDTPPFGSRMPAGGARVPDSLVQRVRTWIDQGALDN